MEIQLEKKRNVGSEVENIEIEARKTHKEHFKIDFETNSNAIRSVPFNKDDKTCNLSTLMDPIESVA